MRVIGYICGSAIYCDTMCQWISTENTTLDGGTYPNGDRYIIIPHYKNHVSQFSKSFVVELATSYDMRRLRDQAQDDFTHLV